MKDKSSNSLSAREESLLCRYFDGECNWFQSILAKRLVNSSEDAKKFLTTLDKLKLEINTREPLPLRNAAAFWEDIEIRIDQEERSAVFQGDRIESEQPGIFEYLFSRRVWASGMGGAVVCATVLMMVVPGYKGSKSGGLASSADNEQTAQMSHGRPVILNDHTQQAFEVDWMRGGGPMRVIPDPVEHSAIIWVKRRPQQDSDMRSRNSSTVRRNVFPERVQTP